MGKINNVYFKFPPTQQFIKGIQKMTCLHESSISEAQHVSTRNGSSSGVGSSKVLNIYLILIHIAGLFFVLLFNLLQDSQN
jgi:hypothetical protein